MSPSRVRRSVLPVTAVGMLLLAPVAASAQAAPQPEAREAFEVATVRQNKSGTGGGQQRLPGGRYVATNMTLRALVRLAYGNASLFRPEDQIVGGPGWMNSDRFDIEAKAAAEFVPDEDGVVRQHLRMLRTLLEERFRIAARMEKRELPIYALVMARKDGSFGPDLQRSTIDCSPGAPAPPPGAKCGVSSEGQALVGRGVTMTHLITFLTISPAVGRLVQDHTGLTGAFDMRLEFVRPFVLGPGGAVPNPDVDSGPTIFTALQEQLGLKLEPRRTPLDVLVLERVERLSDQER